MGMGDMYTLGPRITSESSHAISSSMLVQILPVLSTDGYYHVDLFDSLQLTCLRFTNFCTMPRLQPRASGKQWHYELL